MLAINTRNGLFAYQDFSWYNAQIDKGIGLLLMKFSQLTIYHDVTNMRR